MKIKITKELLDKFYRDECSNEEKRLVLDWLKDDRNKEEADLMMKEHWDKPSLSTIPEPDFEALFYKVNRTVDSSKSPLPNSFRQGFLLKIAAVFIGLLILTGITYNIYRSSNVKTIMTSYGQTTVVTLPDNSRVTLNGNSILKFQKNWNKNEIREVWLEGEAFFSVTHTANHQKFIVNTSDDFRVEVLGTKFNVTKRNTGTRVVLSSGKVRLNINDNQNVMMKPGEMIEFKEDPEKFVRSNVNPEVYSSWRSNKLILDKTKLRDIIAILEETYGVEVNVTDTTTLNQLGSGSIPTDNMELLVDVVAEIFDLEAIKEGNHITYKLKRKSN